MTDTINAIKGFFRVLLTPTCWIQGYPYSEEWDQKLNQLLSAHEFSDMDEFTAKLGNVRVWIKNHPYCSMHPVQEMATLRVRAKRITTLRAGDRLSSKSPTPAINWEEWSEK